MGGAEEDLHGITLTLALSQKGRVDSARGSAVLVVCVNGRAVDGVNLLYFFS